jgi:hypothetical protein
MSGPDFDALREQGREAAQRSASEQAPTDTLERVAWAAGWGQDDELRRAVETARAAGAPWSAIADAIGIAAGTAETKYGSGYERQRRYRARKRREG